MVPDKQISKRIRVNEYEQQWLQSSNAKRTHFPAAHEASMSDMMSAFSSASVGEVDADMTDEDTASEEWRTNGAAVRRER
jgi:hypothetical protein